jgi:DNA-binding NarL/FixJ family response regulator
MTRILIADEHEVVRTGLRSILETRPDWEVVAEAADSNEALVKAFETNPDVAVVDCALPLINGLELTRLIRRRLPSTEVLIFSMPDNEALIDKLLRAGARGGVLLKSDAKRQLLDAVETLASHKPFVTDKVTETLLESFLAASSHGGDAPGPHESQAQGAYHGGVGSLRRAQQNRGGVTVGSHDQPHRRSPR